MTSDYVFTLKYKHKKTLYKDFRIPLCNTTTAPLLNDQKDYNNVTFVHASLPFSVGVFLSQSFFTKSQAFGQLRNIISRILMLCPLALSILILICLFFLRYSVQYNIYILLLTKHIVNAI